jgi:hypothetical protein
VAAVAVAVVAKAAALPAGLARYWLAPGDCSGSGAALAGIAIRQILVCPGLGLYTYHRRLALGGCSPVLVPSDMYQGTFAKTKSGPRTPRPPPRWPPGPGFLSAERGRAA